MNLQAWPRLYKLNGLLKVHILDSVLAVLLLFYALMFVPVYKCKYFLGYLKSHVPVLSNKYPSLTLLIIQNKSIEKFQLEQSSKQ